MALRRKERTSPRPPSGDQLEIAHGDQRAIVVEAGGGVRSYSAGGRELLDAYGADEMCKSGRGQVLIPWPNRLQDGSYEFGGQTHQLPLDQLSEHHAIHGLVRWAAWTVREHESDRVVVEHVIHPRPGYPFSLALSIEYRLSGEGLRVATTATNVGAARCPYGCGAHPYLTLGTATIDSLALQVPAGTVLQSDERGIPVGTAPVEGTEYDFRQPREIGRTEMDNGFTDLERDHEGVARVELRDPNGGRALSLWVDESYPYLMIFTGDPLPDVARRSLAVEPMTCPPNAFRTGQDLISLDPGRSVTCSWGIRPGPPSPRPGDVDDPRVG